MVSSVFPSALCTGAHRLIVAERNWPGMRNTPEYHNVKRLEEYILPHHLEVYFERCALTAPQIVSTHGVNNVLYPLQQSIFSANCLFLTLTRE
jgi:hypothetical protein